MRVDVCPSMFTHICELCSVGLYTVNSEKYIYFRFPKITRGTFGDLVVTVVNDMHHFFARTMRVVFGSSMINSDYITDVGRLDYSTWGETTILKNALECQGGHNDAGKVQTVPELSNSSQQQCVLTWVQSCLLVSVSSARQACIQ